MDKSLHICKTAFVLTFIAYFITIFTIDPLPFGFYQHTVHLLSGPVFVQILVISISFLSVAFLLCCFGNPKGLRVKSQSDSLVLVLPPVSVSLSSSTQALLSLIPLVSTCSLQRFILNKWGYQWDFVWARSLFLWALLLSSGQTWKLPWILIWMGFVGLNCLNVL